MTEHSTRSDFDLGSRLGKGSFGEVFAAKRRKDGKLYVIKMIRIAELSQKEQRAAVNEVHVMASLSSPYVVRYYDSFIEDGLLHIVMEYCSRGDLQQLIKAETEANAPPMDEERVWAIFLQVLLGLAYLHSRRILHRDLKSANIFLATGGFIKIGDLGVARVLGTESFFAKTCVGTPYYLSPELCEDKPYNDKSDMWALGCVLYELCTRKHPFDARNQGALVLKIIQGKYPPVSSTTYSLEMRTMIDLLLARDTRRRPSAADLLSTPHIFERIQALQASSSIEGRFVPSLRPPQILSSADADAAVAATEYVAQAPTESESSIAALVNLEENDDVQQSEQSLPFSSSVVVQSIGEHEEGDNVFERNSPRPPSPLNAEADALALAVYDKCLSTSMKLTGTSKMNSIIDSKEQDLRSGEIRNSHSANQSTSLDDPLPPPSSVAPPLQRRSKWFDAVEPLGRGAFIMQDVEVRGRPQTTTNVSSSRNQQLPRLPIHQPRPIGRSVSAHDEVSSPASEKVGPYVSIGGGGGGGGSLHGPRSLTAVGGSRRVRKGDPSGGVRQKKVLPLSEEAQRAAAVAAAGSAPRGYARSSSSGSGSTSSNHNGPVVVRVRTPIRTSAPTNPALLPVAPRSPSQHVQQQRNDELARIRAREEVAALPDFMIPTEPILQSVPPHTSSHASTKRENSHRPSISLLKSVCESEPPSSNAIYTVDDVEGLNSNEKRVIEDDKLDKFVIVHGNKDEEAENEDDEYEADFDEEQPLNENDATQDVIAELYAEREILLSQVEALSAACRRVMPPATAARFLEELMAIPRHKGDDNEDDDEALERMTDAEETLSVESYLILYRLNYARTRLREIEECLGNENR